MQMHDGTGTLKERILLFTSRPEDWQPLLAQPEKHWKRGYSARALAQSWEAANGFPVEVQLAFSQSTAPQLLQVRPLLAIPEFKVPLPPAGGRASQNDIFVLAKSLCGPVTIMVEGKVEEPFGETLQQFRADLTEGREERLRFLLRMLGLASEPDGGIRYQLLHRTASAIITGEQYRAAAAVLLIHSFSRRRTGWVDYQAFTRIFAIEADIGTIQKLDANTASGIPLFGVWVEGNPCYLKC
jgi:hypothetical protein